MRYLLIFAFLASTLLSANQAPAQNIDKLALQNLADSIFQRGLSKGYVVGAAISIVQGDSVLLHQGYGYANIDTSKRVEANTTIFQLGSVGKVFTAIAVLKLVDQGLLDLDANIQTYVPEIEIIPDMNAAVTLRHLLTHSAGFEERIIGYAARSREEIQPLGEHLQNRLPSLYIRPGTEISYSNYGYALAGYIVEKTSNTPFVDYVQANILNPLRMGHSGYTMDGSLNLESDEIATGYDSNQDGNKPLPIFYRHPTPAGGISSSAQNMTNFMRMIISGITPSGDSLLSASSHDLLTGAQFSNHPQLTGYTMGFEQQSFHGHNGIAKGGSVPGFYPLLVFIPELDVGIFIATNLGWDTILEEFMDAFVAKFLPQRLTPWPTLEIPVDRFTGSYRSNRYNRHDIEDIFELFQGSMDFWSEEGKLITFHDGRRQEYAPIGALEFQNVSDPSRLLVFHEDVNKDIIGVSWGHKIAGILIPSKLEKVPWFDSPYFINEYFGFVPLLIVTYFIMPLFWLAVAIRRRWEKSFFGNRIIPSGAHIFALLFTTLLVIWVFLYFVPLIRNLTDLFFGLKPSLRIYHWLPYFKTALLLGILYWVFQLWRKKLGNIPMRLYYAIFAIACIIWLVFLERWHFFGFNY